MIAKAKENEPAGIQNQIPAGFISSAAAQNAAAFL